jgi:endo-1,4-beta-xylanase
MLKKRLIWIVAAALFTVANMGAAQDMAPTLRELAERNNLFIGAAVYTPHLNDPGYVDTIVGEFNMLTPENEAKACFVQSELGRFDFRAFDRLVNLAEDNGMEVHGHTLVWHQCVPGWLANGEYTRDEAIDLLRDHIYTVVGRYKGRVPIWDVVNEGIDDSGRIRDTPWQRLIGDDYIELAFRFAHEADPDALLFTAWDCKGISRWAATTVHKSVKI